MYIKAEQYLYEICQLNAKYISHKSYRIWKFNSEIIVNIG